MRTRPDRWLLRLRAAYIGSLFFLLGAAGHVQADGLLPGRATMAALLITSIWATAALLRSRASTPRLVGLLVAGQTLVHLALTLTAGHRGDPVSPAVAATVRPLAEVGRSGSLHDLYQAQVAGLATTGVGVGPLGLVFTDLTTNLPMVLAHVAVAVLVGWWVGQGERALWRLIDLAVAVVRRCLTPTAWSTPVTAGAPAPIAVADLAPRLAALLQPLTRRGPPVRV